jgi:hypothetical protein
MTSLLCCIVLSPVASLTPPFFPDYIIKAQFSERIYLKQNMWFDFLYDFCLKHFSFQEELSEILSQMHTFLHMTYPLFLSDLNEI